MKKLCLILSLFFVSACTTTEKPDAGDRSQSIWREDNPDLPSSTAGDERIEVDVDGLEQALGLRRDVQVLGFKESMFNTCQVGHGYPKNRDCKRQYLVVIHFRLFCRDSVGTISTALGAADLAPLSMRPISWNLKDAKGSIQTDGEGFGQIKMVSSIPQKTQRLRLASGDQFLYIRAGEINRIVTPEPWCTQGYVKAD